MLHRLGGPQPAVLAERVAEELLDLAKGSAVARRTDATATKHVFSTATAALMFAKLADCTAVQVKAA